MNIDRRVQILEDIEEIKNLKSRYLNACDAQDPDQAMNCFASGKIIIDMGHVGFFKTRESFAELYKSAGCHDYIMDLHQGSNPEIKIIDDTNAKGLWGLNYRNINLLNNTVTLVSAFYHDQYKRIADKWKIVSSVTEYKSALHLDYSQDVLKKVIADKTVAGTVEYKL